MEDKEKSQAQLIKELQLIRQHVAELERDKVEYQQLTKQWLLENDESMREYFDIYFYARDIVVSVDMKTEKVLRCNRVAMKALGYSREEIVEHPIFKLYHQDYLEDAKKLFRLIAETGEIHDAEQTLRKRDGGKISVSLNAATIRDEDGNPTSVQFDWRDITKHAAEIGDLRSENRQLMERLSSNRLEHPEVFSDIVTQNPAMDIIFRKVELLAASALPVLITGETGVGKEKIAAAIHQLSGRPGKFVKADIAGVDDQLFSDTLFGHKKGAFTGANTARRGLVEQASGGTLFLDEIGDLSIESQLKLLRFLQEGEYYPLGMDEAKTCDVRVITATNRTIEFLTAGGTFREDLYFRFRAHHIHLPPLRERKGDIPLLVSHFLKQSAAALDKKTPTPPPELFTILGTYHFPGNIRELEAMVHDAVSQHEGGVLSTESFREEIDEQTSASGSDTVNRAREVGFSEALASTRSLPSLKEVEPLVIAEALRRTDGNQTIAARLLGVSRKALSSRLSRARITTP